MNQGFCSIMVRSVVFNPDEEKAKEGEGNEDHKAVVHPVKAMEDTSTF